VIDENDDKCPDTKEAGIKVDDKGLHPAITDGDGVI